MGAFVRFLSHQCALESMGYDSFPFCHGRGRGFEPRRPRQILKDLSPFWHVTSRYKKVQVSSSNLVGRAGAPGQATVPVCGLSAASTTIADPNGQRFGVLSDGSPMGVTAIS